MTELVQHQKFAYWSSIGRGKKGRRYFWGVICRKGDVAGLVVKSVDI